MSVRMMVARDRSHGLHVLAAVAETGRLCSKLLGWPSWPWTILPGSSWRALSVTSKD